MDKTISISELRRSLASVIEDVHEKDSRYIILQHSQARAVLLSPAEMEILEDKTERASLKEVERAEEDSGKKKMSSYDKFYGKR